MSNKYAKARKLGYTLDHDIAFKVLDFVVQCGECYIFYNGLKNNGKCPCCGNEEWVGNR